MSVHRSGKRHPAGHAAMFLIIITFSGCIIQDQKKNEKAEDAGPQDSGSSEPVDDEICANGGYWNQMNTGFEETTLTGIWGTSSSNIYTTGLNGLILHFDGEEWSVALKDTSCSFRVIQGRSGKEIYAGGSRDAGQGFRTCMYEFNGESWNKMDMDFDGRVRSLSMTDSSLFAVGKSQSEGKIWQLEGEAWREIEHDLSTVKDVQALINNSVYFLSSVIDGWNGNEAIESGLVIHYNGSSFNTILKEPDIFFQSVSGTDDLFFTAENYVEDKEMIYTLQDGEFQKIVMKNDVHLEDIWAISNDSVFAAGRDGLIMHYDGSGWNRMDSGTDKGLDCIWGLSGKNAYAVSGSGLVLHYACEKEQYDNNDDDEKSDWEKIIDEGGPGAIWVTESGEVYGAYNGISRLNGDQMENLWSPQSTAQGIVDIWGASDTEIWGAGNVSTLVRCMEDECEKLECAINAEFNAIFGASSEDIYIVGGRGNGNAATSAIIHFDGTECSEMAVNSPAMLHDVWASGPDDVFAVGQTARGDYGYILHFDGTEWSESLKLENEDFMAIWGSSSSDVYAASQNVVNQIEQKPPYGLLLHFNGSEWTEINIDEQLEFHAVWSSSAENVFAAAKIEENLEGAPEHPVYHYDGDKWIETAGDIEWWLSAIHGNSSGDVYLLDAEGGLYRYLK